MEHLTDNAETGGLRHRWVHGQVAGDSSARGQIARFLHKHKNDYGCNKLVPTEGSHSETRLSAMALSRWDDEGGAVRDGLPM